MATEKTKTSETQIRGEVAYNMTHNRFDVLWRGEWHPAVECPRHGWTPRAPGMSGKKRWVCRCCQDASLQAADTLLRRRLEEDARSRLLRLRYGGSHGDQTRTPEAADSGG
jgi:hypothetical protein